MKKTLTAVLAVSFLAAAGIAVAAAPPETVVLKAKPGDVTFSHKAHMKQGCKNCHGEGKPEKIALDKDKAHKLCTECHVEKKAGPQDGKKCTDCHKKG